ncbi:KH domain-containing protein [Zea mays]|uniref:KH domain-containing protein n=1 Tax=Zea mays TaxID=4577 RepID=A0A1D6G6T5_MAIZE|nr:KH domain-containing protein [Zea mays]
MPTSVRNQLQRPAECPPAPRKPVWAPPLPSTPANKRSRPSPPSSAAPARRDFFPVARPHHRVPRPAAQEADPRGHGASIPQLSSQSSAPQYSSYGGYQGTSKKIEIPNGRVGVIIGKAGETIRYIQLQSGAKIQVTRDHEAEPGALTRQVELSGKPEQLSKAEQLIKEVLAEVLLIMLTAFCFVLVILQLISEVTSEVTIRAGDTSTERTVHIDDTQEQIEAAKQLISEVTSCFWFILFIVSFYDFPRFFLKILFLLLIAALH